MIGVYKKLDKYDPTHTTSLRNRFARQMRKRFDFLYSLVRKAIVVDDCFALKEEKNLLTMVGEAGLTPGHRAYEFMTSQEKLQAFMEWIREQEKRHVLQVTRIPQLGSAREEAWTNLYIDSAYRAGVARAREQIGVLPSLAGKIGEAPVSFLGPFHMDRVGLLYLRVFTDLQGITEAMDTLISRALAQGMAEGRNPRQIAQIMNKIITGGGGDLSMTDTLGRFIPAKRRAEILARTEIIRAHHLATIQEYRNFGVLGVKVKAEWRTAGDDRVCDECAEMEGKIFTLDEIEFMIPAHPQCRCIALPLDVTDQK